MIYEYLNLMATVDKRKLKPRKPRPTVSHLYDRTPKGNVLKTPKIGRNDKCPCRSGLKYKKCCLGKES